MKTVKPRQSMLAQKVDFQKLRGGYLQTSGNGAQTADNSARQYIKFHE
jgi:hypothetical protein